MKGTYSRPGLFFKGFALGSANVIPGVSGGTIALITGIFERLINSIRHFDMEALKLLLKRDLKGFAEHTDLEFLGILAAGIAAAIFSLARIFEFLFTNYPVHIWSYFFGLILASIYYVGKTVDRWNFTAAAFFLIGFAVAAGIAVMKPVPQNEGLFYLILCGVAGICSMILPGLSGSFVLIIMGNYHLIVIDAVNNLRLDILIPFAIGAALGLALFARLLSWLMEHFRNATLAVLTGFIAGSLMILWPWKSPVFLRDSAGEFILKAGEKIVLSYDRSLPDLSSVSDVTAILIMAAGIGTIIVIETLSSSENAETED